MVHKCKHLVSVGYEPVQTKHSLGFRMSPKKVNAALDAW